MVFLLRPFREHSLMLGVEVRFFGDAKNLLCFAKLQDWNGSRHQGCCCAEGLKDSRVARGYPLQDMADNTLKHQHDLGVVSDKSHLKVQRAVLVQVARGRMLLSAEDLRC